MEVKSYIKHINILFTILLYLNLFQINSDIFYPYSLTITLSNGNLFIVYKYGIDICNHNLTKIIKSSIVFSNNEQITNDNLSKIVFSKCEDGYILCLINDKIYIFNSEGNFIFQSEKINKNHDTDFYTLYAVSGRNCYNYYIGFISNNLLYLYYYEYKSLANRTNLLASNEGFQCYLGLTKNKYNLKNSGLSCQLMKSNSYGESLVCNYILMVQDKENFAIGFYIIYRNTIIENSNFRPEYNETSNIKFLKVNINNDNTKLLICLILITGENNCFNYDINNPYDNGFPLNYFNCNNKMCKKEYYALKVNYIPEKDEFIFSCSGNNGNISFCIFDNTFNYKEINKFDDCETIDGYSTIYSKDAKDYYIISDVKCNGEIKSIQPLIDNIDDK